MKIALLTYSTKPRGSVIHTLELATALADLGHYVCIFALAKEGLGFDQPVPCHVRLVPAKPAPQNTERLIQQRIQEFVDFLASEPDSFDIYHAQDCIGANALLTLRQQGKVARFVRTVHHIEDFVSPYLKQCQDRSITEPDLCLCVSDRWQWALQTDYGVDAARVLNGVNLNRFETAFNGREAQLKAHYGLTGTPLYLTIGGIEPRKNSLGLLQAFAQVLTVYPQAQLAIAGGATLFDYQPYRERFFATANTLGITIGQSLVLLGVVPASDLPALYRCADAFCLPSYQEGWGLVVLEAIASGLPVVVSEQPPFTEFLNQTHAFWAQPHDPKSIATAMVKAIDEVTPALLSASQAILPQYSWQSSAQLHEQYYRQLLLTKNRGY